MLGGQGAVVENVFLRHYGCLPSFQSAAAERFFISKKSTHFRYYGHGWREIWITQNRISLFQLSRRVNNGVRATAYSSFWSLWVHMSGHTQPHIAQSAQSERQIQIAHTAYRAFRRLTCSAEKVWEWDWAQNLRRKYIQTQRRIRMRVSTE